MSSSALLVARKLAKGWYLFSGTQFSCVLSLIVPVRPLLWGRVVAAVKDVRARGMPKCTGRGALVSGSRRSHADVLERVAALSRRGLSTEPQLKRPTDIWLE